MKPKCLICKECMELFFEGGIRHYYCTLCNTYYKLTLSGIEVVEKPHSWEGNYNLP